jgi:hypothetical protein
VESWEDFTYDFGFSEVPHPFWWNIPFTRPHMRRNFPRVDFRRAFRDWREGDDNLARVIWDQMAEDDFAIILFNYPRIAVTFDSELGEVRGINDEGVAHLGFNFSRSQGYFYATRNSWKRLFGFNDFYDWLGGNLGRPIGVNYFDLETTRLTFDYQCEEIMVQLWKGSYFFDMFTGAELGFYSRPLTRRVEHWDCFPLSRSFNKTLRLVSNCGTYEFFSMPEYYTWWIMMLENNQPVTQADNLTMYYTGDFSKEPGLGEAFYNAMVEQMPELNPQKNGNVVSLRWRLAG